MEKKSKKPKNSSYIQRGISLARIEGRLLWWKGSSPITAPSFFQQRLFCLNACILVAKENLGPCGKKKAFCFVSNQPSHIFILAFVFAWFADSKMSLFFVNFLPSERFSSRRSLQCTHPRLGRSASSGAKYRRTLSFPAVKHSGEIH